jgi:hypothetical protein
VRAFSSMRSQYVRNVKFDRNQHLGRCRALIDLITFDLTGLNSLLIKSGLTPRQARSARMARLPCL